MLAGTLQQASSSTKVGMATNMLYLTGIGEGIHCHNIEVTVSCSLIIEIYCKSGVEHH